MITKIILKSKLIAICLIYSQFAFAQNDWFILKASHVVKGLDNIESFREVLIANGLNLKDKGKIGNTINGYYEDWEGTYTRVEINRIPGINNFITIQIHEALSDIPERFITSIKQIFPNKEVGRVDNYTAVIDNTLIYERDKYVLTYTRDIDKTNVKVWFNYPTYFFRFEENQ